MKTAHLMMVLACTFALHFQAAQAKSLDAFNKRFQIVRSDDGKLIGIRDLTLPTKFSIVPYVKLIKSQLLEEQALMAEEGLNGNYEEAVKNALNVDRDFEFNGDQTQYDQNVEVVVKSLKELAALNVDYIFSKPEFVEVVNKYEGKLNEAILLLDPTMIANVNDSSYFYKKNVSYKAVTWGLDFARKRLASIPMLNTVSHVIVKVESLINERRMFHQNMLMHYLENFKEEELGLSHEEVNLIWSSIYESRIPWYAFWESNNAKANWSKYGVNNFYSSFRVASTNLRTAQPLYTEVGERMNYSFQKVTFNNEKVAVNLFDKESMFQNRPAVAFNFDKPSQIARKRVLLGLAELGISFVPMKAFLKDMATSFIKSFYEQQKITEGALYCYFESNKDIKGTKQIAAQYLNPFDLLAL
jgi:hypothetical protein